MCVQTAELGLTRQALARRVVQAASRAAFTAASLLLHRPYVQCALQARLRAVQVLQSAWRARQASTRLLEQAVVLIAAQERTKRTQGSPLALIVQAEVTPPVKEIRIV